MPKARIHTLLAAPLSGAEIERRSFAIIDAAAPKHNFDPGEWEIVRRMLHTAGDLSLAAEVRFANGAIAAGVAALHAGAPLYVDANMIRAGISLERLRLVNSEYGPEKIHCHVADGDVARDAAQNNLPRALHAIRKARAILPGAIVAIGNSPVALLELNRMILEEGLRPALVIGLPVGFVHVIESKEELLTLPAPSIVVVGRRGGSSLAVAAIHALCTLAERIAEKSKGKEAPTDTG